MGAILRLDKPNSKELTRILIVVNHKKQILRFPTGERVNPSDWNTNKAEVRKSHPESIEINTRIEKQIAEVEKALNHLKRNDEPVTSTAIRQLTNGMIKGRGTEQSFKEYLSKLIDEISTGKRMTKRGGRPFAKGTIQNYEDLLRMVTRYEKKGEPTKLIGVDKNYIGTLIASLGDVSANYEAKITNLIKVILKKAKADGLDVSDVSDLKANNELTDQIVLTEKELSTIHHLELEGVQLKTRDWFLIGCYTGLRFSDLTRLRPDNVTKTTDGYRLTIETQKTHQKIVIPLNKIVVEIMDRNNWNLPKILMQHMNTTIKEVCRLAGLTERITTGKTRNHQRVELIKQKWELVSSHTMRRSFATNLYLAGVETTLIRKLTGHKTESSFFRYIRVDENENADIAAKLPFFQ